MSYSGAVDRRVRAAIPSPQIVLGTIASVSRSKVTVSGVADQPIPCDWSSTFDAEMRASSASLVGRQVEVHVIDGQHIIAYTIVIGEKPNAF